MKLDNVSVIAVAGAGQMGRGISQVCATAGYTVLLFDALPAALDDAVRKIRTGLTRAVERGAVTEAEAARIIPLIQPTRDLERFRAAQLVIEAIPEEVGLKQDLFARLGGLCRPEAVLASNTSSIAIGRLAAAAGRPDRVVGLHFMNPPPLMRLVEIVRGRDTSEETLTLAVEFAKRVGKTPVIAQDVPGFIVNRVLMPMINEAVFALEAAVASAEDIDLALTAGANHPVGPLALADRIGLDTVLAICEVLHRDLGDEKFRPCPLLRRFVEAGRLGRKSGRGFYDYDDAGAPVRPSEGREHREGVRTEARAGG